MAKDNRLESQKSPGKVTSGRSLEIERQPSKGNKTDMMKLKSTLRRQKQRNAHLNPTWEKQIRLLTIRGWNKPDLRNVFAPKYHFLIETITRI